MYDNLLRPNSPKKMEEDVILNNVDCRMGEENIDIKEENEGDEEHNERDMEIEESLPSTEPVTMAEHYDTPENEEEEEDEPGETEEQTEINNVEETNILSPKRELESEVPQKNPSIEDEWSTDTDSNSTAPEMEVKQITPDPCYTVTSLTEEKQEKNPEESPGEAPPPPVKLVISKKKGSIFKSRTLVDDNASKKRRALYKHKWTDDNKEVEKDAVKVEEATDIGNSNLDEDFKFSDSPLERFVKEGTDGDVTGVKCEKSDKPVSLKISY